MALPLSWVEPPDTRPTTPLWQLGFKFEEIARTFLNLGEDIQNVLFIGSWLSYPFIVIGAFFIWCQVHTWEADKVIGFALQRLNELLEGWLIVDILKAVWSDFTLLKDNPGQWVLTRILYLWSEFNAIRSDPWGWLRNKINNLFPLLSFLMDNTRQWFLDTLSRYFPLLYKLFISPLSTILDWIYTLFPLIRSLFDNPSQFIVNYLIRRYGFLISFFSNPRGYIVEAIMSYYPALGEILFNPVSWLGRRLGQLLGFSFTSTLDFIFRIMNMIFTVIETDYNGARETVKKKICDIIVQFM